MSDPVVKDAYRQVCRALRQLRKAVEDNRGEALGHERSYWLAASRMIDAASTSLSYAEEFMYRAGAAATESARDEAER